MSEQNLPSPTELAASHPDPTTRAVLEQFQVFVDAQANPEHLRKLLALLTSSLVNFQEETRLRLQALEFYIGAPALRDDGAPAFPRAKEQSPLYSDLQIPEHLLARLDRIEKHVFGDKPPA